MDKIIRIIMTIKLFPHSVSVRLSFCLLGFARKYNSYQYITAV